MLAKILALFSRKKFEPDSKLRAALKTLANMNGSVYVNQVNVKLCAKYALLEDDNFAREGLRHIANSVPPNSVIIDGIDVGAVAARGLKD